jgi:predicted short-subunit dehydrogenase-like oxidoreductase (DUF2520 family)
MKNQRSLGLVVEGNATSSLILRLPSMVEELGPIKAGALRVARRLSNFLRAGYAVGKYDDLQTARTILLRVPDAALPRIIDELCASDLDLKDLAFVLCESCLSTAALAALEKRGAWTATLAPVPTLRKSWFVVEGHSTVLRHLRRFLERNEARAFELRPGAKPLYFAAQIFATMLPMELFAGAQQALRSAGISGNHLHELLEEMSLEMFRSFSNGVRIAWPGAKSGCSPATYLDYLDRLRHTYPQIAASLDEHLRIFARHKTAEGSQPVWAKPLANDIASEMKGRTDRKANGVA